MIWEPSPEAERWGLRLARPSPATSQELPDHLHELLSPRVLCRAEFVSVWGVRTRLGEPILVWATFTGCKNSIRSLIEFCEAEWGGVWEAHPTRAKDQATIRRSANAAHRGSAPRTHPTLG